MRIAKFGFVLMLISASLTFTHVKSIKVVASKLAVDKLQNGYVVNDRNQIVKYDSDGTRFADYDVKSLGQIGTVDPRNPMKILVLFPEFMTLVTLDNRLGETTRMNLTDHGFNRVTTVTRSFDDHFWVFDEIELKLKKVNEAGQVVIESDLFPTLRDEKDFQPNFILERNNLVFVNDPKIGIMVFDVFATYNKTIPLKGLSEFQVSNDILSYVDGTDIVKYHLKTFQEFRINVPGGPFLDAKTSGGSVFVVRENGLDLYRLNQ
jgi:hypothetical protein